MRVSNKSRHIEAYIHSDTPERESTVYILKAFCLFKFRSLIVIQFVYTDT